MKGSDETLTVDKLFKTELYVFLLDLPLYYKFYDKFPDGIGFWFRKSDTCTKLCSSLSVAWIIVICLGDSFDL